MKSVFVDKNECRTEMLTRRRRLDEKRWRESSLEAQLRLIAIDEYRKASAVAIYHPVHNETDTGMIAEYSLDQGKRLLYPVICGTEMKFWQISDMGELRQGRFGIKEPSCERGDEEPWPEMILLPGVAFDKAGHRIGYGKGYYDRCLRANSGKSRLIGFCHDFQLIDGLIRAEKHDIRVEVIVTDRRTLHIGM